jgi:hypothetical protein
VIFLRDNKIDSIIEGLQHINELGTGDYEERTYKIKSIPRNLDKLEELLRLMEYLGSVGASREINIYFDGDGAAHIIPSRVDSGKSVSLRNIVNKEFDTDKSKFTLSFD